MPQHLVLFGKRGPRSLLVALCLGPGPVSLVSDSERGRELEGMQQRKPNALNNAWRETGWEHGAEGRGRCVHSSPRKVGRGLLQGLGREAVVSVCPSISGCRRRGLFGRFGLSPIRFAIHLLVGTIAGAFPGHSAGHDKRQVPAPEGRGRGRGSVGTDRPGAAAAQHTHLKANLRGKPGAWLLPPG